MAVNDGLEVPPVLVKIGARVLNDGHGLLELDACERVQTLVRGAGSSRRRVGRGRSGCARVPNQGSALSLSGCCLLARCVDHTALTLHEPVSYTHLRAHETSAHL
eukprot:13680212-Alexandrium_andersonii.AAC.1